MSQDNVFHVDEHAQNCYLTLLRSAVAATSAESREPDPWVCNIIADMDAAQQEGRACPSAAGTRMVPGQMLAAVREHQTVRWLRDVITDTDRAQQAHQTCIRTTRLCTRREHTAAYWVNVLSGTLLWATLELSTHRARFLAQALTSIRTS